MGDLPNSREDGRITNRVPHADAFPSGLISGKPCRTGVRFLCSLHACTALSRMSYILCNSDTLEAHQIGPIQSQALLANAFSSHPACPTNELGDHLFGVAAAKSTGSAKRKRIDDRDPSSGFTTRSRWWRLHYQCRSLKDRIVSSCSCISFALVAHVCPSPAYGSAMAPNRNFNLLPPGLLES